MNNTLIKGMQLLELLVRSERPLGVSEMASRLDMGKSNVHRLLQALVDMHYATKNETAGTYAASLKIWELGLVLAARLDIPKAAAASMNHLLQSTRETVHLSILDGIEVVYVHKIDSPEPVRAYSEIGGRAPAHCVATGKAILAWQPAEMLNDLSLRLVPHTPNTIVVAADFLREMEKVRDIGYAINRGEWRETVWGVAAPIRDISNKVIAAIGISGPAERIRPARLKRLSSEVVAAAAAVSREVGGVFKS